MPPKEGPPLSPDERPPEPPRLGWASEPPLAYEQPISSDEALAPSSPDAITRRQLGGPPEIGRPAAMAREPVSSPEPAPLEDPDKAFDDLASDIFKDLDEQIEARRRAESSPEPAEEPAQEPSVTIPPPPEPKQPRLRHINAIGRSLKKAGKKVDRAITTAGIKAYQTGEKYGSLPLTVAEKAASFTRTGLENYIKNFNFRDRELTYYLGGAFGVLESGVAMSVVPPGVSTLFKAGLNLALVHSIKFGINRLAESRYNSAVKKLEGDLDSLVIGAREAFAAREKHQKSLKQIQDFTAGMAASAALSSIGLSSVEYASSRSLGEIVNGIASRMKDFHDQGLVTAGAVLNQAKESIASKVFHPDSGPVMGTDGSFSAESTQTPSGEPAQPPVTAPVYEGAPAKPAIQPQSEPQQPAAPQSPAPAPRTEATAPPSQPALPGSGSESSGGLNQPETSSAEELAQEAARNAKIENVIKNLDPQNSLNYEPQAKSLVDNYLNHNGINSSSLSQREYDALLNKTDSLIKNKTLEFARRAANAFIDVPDMSQDQLTGTALYNAKLNLDSLLDLDNVEANPTELETEINQALDSATYKANAYSELIKDRINNELSANEGFSQTNTIAPGETFGHLLSKTDNALTWGASDAEVFGAHIAANYDLLTQTWGLASEAGVIPEGEHFPLSLNELNNLIELAENGDTEAIKKLRLALKWIPANEKFTLLSKDGVAAAMKVLGR